MFHKEGKNTDSVESLEDTGKAISVLPVYLISGSSPAGGADLGTRPPAAGSLHRAGCEDGRAGRRQDPLYLFPILANSAK